MDVTTFVGSAPVVVGGTRSRISHIQFRSPQTTNVTSRGPQNDTESKLELASFAP
ncbi:hypothetical protein PHLCEN_2v2199 [Hermanssonia centrifuga]|uniref:Uncharacterized protein n=1 Tax=Hermanssonia centrifuga TaxID=98765 RepID=A0A2R6RPR6_9APHY|nr:hypothetical protein PHLCEN_2v2199 [Hermanssonia centrifuga]